MKKFVVLVTAIFFAVMSPLGSFASEQEDSLRNVVFHTDYVDSTGANTMRQGVATLWTVVEPYAEKQGLTAFPKMNIWGFSTKEKAIAHSGRRSFWQNFGGGYANPGQAYVLLENNSDIGVVAHEATHVLQFALSGSNLGNDCLAEGAANWYSTKTKSALGGPTLEYILEVGRPKPVDPVHQKILENAGIEVPNNRWDNDIPTFKKLSTRAQFNQVKSYNLRVYSLCMFAFNLLIETGGGEEAYFNYLAETRKSGWRTAFNKVFAEDLETFEARFAVYRESGFRDYRFEQEIRSEELLKNILECESLFGRNICVE